MKCNNQIKNAMKVAALGIGAAVGNRIINSIAPIATTHFMSKFTYHIYADTHQWVTLNKLVNYIATFNVDVIKKNINLSGIMVDDIGDRQVYTLSPGEYVFMYKGCMLKIVYQRSNVQDNTANMNIWISGKNAKVMVDEIVNNTSSNTHNQISVKIGRAHV